MLVGGDDERDLGGIRVDQLDEPVGVIGRVDEQGFPGCGTGDQVGVVVHRADGCLDDGGRGQGAPGRGPRGVDVTGVVVADEAVWAVHNPTLAGLSVPAPSMGAWILVLAQERKGWSVSDRLIVKGAREHNLRGVDLDLPPRDAMIVFTGLSGSGKSSLAFDTIFAEGQRRYVESLSAYARQFLGQMDKPDVDFIEGLSPAVSIDQKSTNRNPRSTVGTITEVYDYLRLLYARAGTPHCPVCGGERIARQTPQQIVDQVLAMEDGTKFQVLAPVVRTRKGEFVDLFDKLNSQGYSRVRVDGGVVHPLTDPPKLKKQEKHDIEVVVDRLTVKASSKQRLTDSVETALGLADGIVVLDFVDREDDHPHREQRFSEKLACPNGHPLAVDDLEPRSFSFNSPYGACPPECTGLGIKKEVDPELVVPPDPELTLAEGAVAPWSMGHTSEYFTRMMAGLGEELGFDVDTPVEAAAGQGTQGHSGGLRPPGSCAVQEPLWPHPVLLRRLRGRPRLPAATDGTDRVRADEGTLRGFMRDIPCPECAGTRLKPEILAVTLAAGTHGAKSIAEVAELSIADCAAFLNALTLAHVSRRSPGRCSRRSSPGWASCSTSAWNTCRCRGPRRRCPAARRSASGWPPKSVPDWWACCMCSTSRPSVCTSATTAS